MTRRLGLVLVVGLAACHLSREPMHPDAPRGSWYVVAAGDTLDEIARRAGVPGDDILEVNGFSRADELRPGRLIFVLAPEGAAGDVVAAADVTGPRVNDVEVTGGPGRFRWPLANVAHLVGSPFGARGPRAHEGIDLPAPTGTPVLAASDGDVVYAGDGIRGYGDLVVLQHPGDLLTVYAHNSQLFVTPGQHVRAGERIALVGQTGRATGPHLHFEVRQGQIPRDPMPYLTSTGGAP
jgi:lipoprotein NlpD